MEKEERKKLLNDTARLMKDVTDNAEYHPEDRFVVENNESIEDSLEKLYPGKSYFLRFIIFLEDLESNQRSWASYYLDQFASKENEFVRSLFQCYCYFLSMERVSSKETLKRSDFWANNALRYTKDALTPEEVGFARKYLHPLCFAVNHGIFPKMRAYVAKLKTPEEKRERGKTLEKLRSAVLIYLRKADKASKKIAMEKKLKETIDPTFMQTPRIANLHPLTCMWNQCLRYFKSQKFDVADGPEIETEKYNFDALNIPEHHPARYMHDTFYVKIPPHRTNGKYLLRTHTSPVQIREMLKKKPPFRLIAPGRVFRCDSDKTHTPMFHQIEGLVLQPRVHMGHMKWLIQDFLQYIFDNDSLKIRLRPNHFPFTEPSAEVDLRDEKQNKWLEVAGCGMVHPNVLKNCNIDPDEWQGFAFGFGIDRLTMLHSGCEDLRSFFGFSKHFNDVYGISPFEGVSQ